MAYVRNRAYVGSIVDGSLTHNTGRINSGSPNGVLTPDFAGQIILDTTNDILWQAQGVSDDTWVHYERSDATR